VKTLTLLLLIATVFTTSVPTAEAARREKARKQTSSIEGQVFALTEGLDRNQRKFLGYEVKSADGTVVVVRDYRFGKRRQPASAQVMEGGSVKVKGFYVKIRTSSGSDERTSVLIIPAN